MQLLCYPLEIRISNMQGREYLMYYESFRRSCTALRIEFIDEIEFYGKEAVRSMLAETEYHPSPETVDADLAHVRASMGYSLGVSTAERPEGNAIHAVQPRTVAMQIAYTPETESYIADRLKRDCRSGSVTEVEGEAYLWFRAEVSDETELRPWVRTFYSRILDCQGMDTGRFSLDADAGRLAEVLAHEAFFAPDAAAAGTRRAKWEIPEDAKATLREGEKAREHDRLFNKAFSIYYYIMGELLTHISAGGEDAAYTEAELDGILRASFDKSYLKIGQETKELLPAEIKELLLQGGFLAWDARAIEGQYERVRHKGGTGFDLVQKRETVYRPKYQCGADLSLYRDAIPLSTLELRWLKTVLGDRKSRLFLSEGEIAALNGLLAGDAPEIQPFPMEKVVWFDGFHFPEKSRRRETKVLAALLEGIYGQRTVRVKYHTMRNRIKTGESKPILLEFSKRNNRFQGFLQECGIGRIYTMNVSRNRNRTGNNSRLCPCQRRCDFVIFRRTENVGKWRVKVYSL